MKTCGDTWAATSTENKDKKTYDSTCAATSTEKPSATSSMPIVLPTVSIENPCDHSQGTPLFSRELKRSKGLPRRTHALAPPKSILLPKEKGSGTRSCEPRTCLSPAGSGRLPGYADAYALWQCATCYRGMSMSMSMCMCMCMCMEPCGVWETAWIRGCMCVMAMCYLL